MSATKSLAIKSAEDFVYGIAPNPVKCGRGLVIGGGTVIPEINFTLPPMNIDEGTWSEVRKQYSDIIEGVCRRASELDVPGLLVELETLPPMTVKPEWGLDITRLLADVLDRYHTETGLKSALRLTPNDSRDHMRPPLMRSGFYWDGMVQVFRGAGAAGADLLAIESTGGKEICDEALMTADLRTMVFALGVLAPRDMKFLWTEIVDACRAQNIVASGDTACGFANTALALAEQKLLPRIFAALVRVASVPRGLVAYECGAVGPGKDCGYENVYMKAIAGVPISMEGRTAACAHLSSMGNIAQAVCDCWSNESVQNVRLLSAQAPVVSVEQLAYDCRLLNTAGGSPHGAQTMRDWLVASDSERDPQAYVLRPDIAVKIGAEIIQESTPYLQTRRAVRTAIDVIRDAQKSGDLRVHPNEIRWTERLAKVADRLPDSEEEFITEMVGALDTSIWIPAEYGL